MNHDRPQIAVGAIVISSARLLMVRRAQNPGRGLWSLPGGRVERGEYLHDALKREVMEETALEIVPGQLVGIFEVVGDQHYVILDFAADVIAGAEPKAGSDVDEARWVPLREVRDLNCTPRFVETLTAWGVLGSD